MKPHLSIVIVNYRSSDALEHCLRSLNVATGTSLEIILVDNSPEDGAQNHSVPGNAKQVLENSGFHGHYFPEPQNIGFSRAVNFGVQHASGDILCIVHPDVLFEAGSLDRMIAWVNQHPRTVVGPREKNAAGEITTTAFPFITRRHVWGVDPVRQFTRIRPWHILASSSFASFRLVRQCRMAIQSFSVPVLSGACLVLPRRLWEEVGGFEEELTSFGLHAEWFQRAKEYGVSAWYIPEAEVFHEHAGSARPQGWHRQELIARDRMWYAKRFGWLAVVVLVAILWMERKFRLPDAP